ncbi:putative dolichol-phosphate mannosyltransferase [Cucumispora dikerogammari]|nr:putative dolichol-phosphate mannosyltransferase [Cucumispora dikerogammari]
MNDTSSVIIRNSNDTDIIFTNKAKADPSIIDIILPTLNEEVNILILLDMLSCKRYHKIIIDDSTNDETLKNIFLYNKIYPINNLTVVRGDRLHLGGAYKKAARYLLGSKVVIMDSDLSHNPEDIRRFLWLGENNSNWDIITGTRYKSMHIQFKHNKSEVCSCCRESDYALLFPSYEPKGGFCVQGGVKWPFFRKIISSGANVLSSLLIGEEYDFTGSYRLYKREIFTEIINNCPSDCFSFQMEALCYAIRKKKVIKECPIIFNDRVYGESKIGPLQILKFVKSLISVAIKGFLCFSLFLLALNTAILTICQVLFINVKNMIQ